MRKINIPAIVQISGFNYDVNLPIFQDDIIRALAPEEGHATYNVDYSERTEIAVDFDTAKQWVENKIHIDPFVFTNDVYYIGNTTPSNSVDQALEALNINAVSLTPTGDSPTRYSLISGERFDIPVSTVPVMNTDSFTLPNYGGGFSVRGSGLTDTDGSTFIIPFSMYFFPISAIRGDSLKDTTDYFATLYIIFTGKVTTLGSVTTLMVTSIHMEVSRVSAAYLKQYSIYGDLIDIPYEDMSADVSGFDGSNPYEINPSTFGGGYGTGTIRSSDPIPDPEAPDIDAITTGLLTVFKPTRAQIQSLGDYLWSSAFDVNTLKKLFSDPMEAIIGLSIIPVNPPAAGSKNVKIGDIDTGISMPYISRQFVEKDLGSITIDPYIGSFMDYAPYTKIDIYLPYIGFRSLDPADVMGTTLSIKYIIDVVTGGCNAVINVSGKGAIYQFNGSCIANIPLSAINYSGAIQNAVSAIGSGITTAVGVASGQAPLAAMGVAGLATQAANTAVNTKEHIQRSGSMGGAAGLCSVQFPYVVIERPRLSTPAGYNRFIGNTLNVTMRLQDCHGLTMVESIHLDNVLCTDEERNELLNLLKEGVIL